MKTFRLSMLILGQKSCILGPTIFKIPNRTDIEVYIDVKETFGENDRNAKMLMGFRSGF